LQRSAAGQGMQAIGYWGVTAGDGAEYRPKPAGTAFRCSVIGVGCQWSVVVAEAVPTTDNPNRQPTTEG
jgi:hypothetical protein